MAKDSKSLALHLPQTDFPMRGALSATEPKIAQKWTSAKLHAKMLAQRASAPSFSLLDGPPYANGPIHLGHAVNKILKDITVKYKSMSGRKAAFVPFWDCHGLPIELAALKKAKLDSAAPSQAARPQGSHNRAPLSEQKAPQGAPRPSGAKMPPAASPPPPLSPKEIRALCRKEALFWVQSQKAAFQRLGVLALYDKTLLTLQSHYEADEVRALAEIAQKGLLYRGKKPVFWCFKLKTALADSEAEYRERKSPSIYVSFQLDEESQPSFPPGDPVCIVIWTTTPWTLPANSAIALHPDVEYGHFEARESAAPPASPPAPRFRRILALSRKEAFEKETGISLSPPQAVMKGRALKGLKAWRPFFEGQKSPLILADYVTVSSGSGCVHTAPAHGLDDFRSGQKFGLDMPCFVDEAGHFTDKAPPPLRGMFILKANSLIAGMLKEKGLLDGASEITHSYPYSPRSNSPLIYRLTSQWFLRLDDPQIPLREKALEAIQNVKFTPAWGLPRLKSMIESSPDWCLSRQRAWGVPIPVFYCEGCSHPLADPELMRQIADGMERSGQGIEHYFSAPVEELLPKGSKCQSCGKARFRKGEDILDVWFDSGVAHRFFPKPSDLFLEGSDQHRGWFQTSLLSSLALDGAAPFKALVTHGFVTDSQGKKMSKSLGNGLDPMDIVRDKGASVLRLWAASEDFSRDIRVSQESLQRVEEAYRRLRNTFRFLLGSLHGFSAKEEIPLPRLRALDRWALHRLSRMTEAIRGFYESFAFHRVYHELALFCASDLSALYFHAIKDRLYTFHEKSFERRSARTALFYITKSLLPLSAPLASFLSEEAYEYFCGASEESVFLESIPPPLLQDDSAEALFASLFPLRDDLNQKLEVWRGEGHLRSSLEAGARLVWPEPPPLSADELCEFFSVSQVSVEKGAAPSIEPFKAKGEKCGRCWMFHEELNARGFCPKCVRNLSGSF